jgi:hypothetical protein
MNKNHIKAAILTAAITFACTRGDAQPNPGDLILGFSSASSTLDYVVDLGSVPTNSMQLGGSINVPMLNSALPGGVNGANAGVVFGVGNGATGDYAGLSVLRTGNNAVGVAGTEFVPGTPSGGRFVTAAASSANSITLGNPDNNSTTSFTFAANTLNPGTLANELGISPLFTINGTTINLDLFESTRLAPSGRSTPASAFTYEGQLDLNFSNPSAPSAEFIPVGAVPEPSTNALMISGGLVALFLRGLLRRKNA